MDNMSFAFCIDAHKHLTNTAHPLDITAYTFVQAHRSLDSSTLGAPKAYMWQLHVLLAYSALASSSPRSSLHCESPARTLDLNLSSYISTPSS